MYFYVLELSIHFPFHVIQSWKLEQLCTSKVFIVKSTAPDIHNSFRYIVILWVNITHKR